MGTTSRGYPTPEGSDNVDIPGDLSALASAINTDVGSVDTAKAAKATTITAGTGLTGGGDLSANRTLAVAYGTTAGTATQGNDPRLSNARTPTAHAASHAPGGSDPITVAYTDITGTPSLASVAVSGAYGDLSGRPTLGGAAALNVGTTAGTVAAGDDPRIVEAVKLPSTTRSGQALRIDRRQPTGVQFASEAGLYLSNVQWPQMAAHRFGPNNYGEETLASARMSWASGVRVLEGDFQFTGDGDVIMMHDTTVDRTTNGTGSVVNLTGEQVGGMRVDLYRADGRTVVGSYAPQRVATVDEVLREFAGRAIMVLEDKTGASEGQVAAAAQRWRQHGYLDSLIIASFNQSVAQRWAAAGFTAQFITTSTVADHAALKAAGIDWIAYQWTTGTTEQVDRIAAAKAAGLRVATWTHTTYQTVQAALAAGSDMPMSDYPVHGQGLRYIDFSQNIMPAGALPQSGQTWTVENGLARSSGGSGSEPYIDLLGCGPMPTSLVGAFTFRHVGPTVSVPVRWAGVQVQDQALNFKNAAARGYLFMARFDGRLDIFDWNGTAGTLLASNTFAALAGDTDYTVEFEITPTTLIVRRGEFVTSVANTTYRPAAGWWPSLVRSSLPEIAHRRFEWRTPA